MQDSFGRTINYLRLSITDRCNLRCLYCMPATGITSQHHDNILRYDEMLRIVAAATTLGIRKVRITGGEPLVRKGVIGFLEQLAALEGIEEIALTTNGILLADYAEELYAAGVKRLNISLDSLKPDTFSDITRGGDLGRVLAGIGKAEQVGMKIKLNLVAMRGVNDHELLDFAALSIDKPWSVRFIEYMPTIREQQWQHRIISGADILALLNQHYQLNPLTADRFCGPARPYRIAGAAGTLGIITPMSEHFCGSCNRIRVTSMGQAKSCLMSNDAVDLRPLLGVRQQSKLIDALKMVICGKPEHHCLGSDPDSTTPFSMASIGG
ncbi:GTP 3',8-cyclase MoaA [Pelobacter sp. M08fum]|uniref:GTP 3',8-cyclase n=2 Tax=Pelovirga terrestris TaxID=2771352 RepID=A0A8J6QMJ9_9BACT|nr:GTP 3',8-cyclase MoaA [Pelovirga terrestris]